jgi:ABC-2 type transport system permease protein
MGTILKHELKANFKTFLIWCLSVSFMSFMCILMFTSVKESMVDMAESFASMGAFSNAFGMDKLSIATLAGFMLQRWEPYMVWAVLCLQPS